MKTEGFTTSKPADVTHFQVFALQHKVQNVHLHPFQNIRAHPP